MREQAPTACQVCINEDLKDLVDEHAASFKVLLQRLHEVEACLTQENERFVARFLVEPQKQNAPSVEDPCVATVAETVAKEVLRTKSYESCLSSKSQNMDDNGQAEVTTDLSYNSGDTCQRLTPPPVARSTTPAMRRPTSALWTSQIRRGSKEGLRSARKSRGPMRHCFEAPPRSNTCPSHTEGAPLLQAPPRRSLFRSATEVFGDSDDKLKETDSRKTHNSSLFADAEMMKERVRENIARKEYNVRDRYKEKGIYQILAKHPLFENLTLLLIACNAIWIWIETDENQSETYLDSSLPFQCADNLLCAYFFLEWYVRFFAFKHKTDVVRDYTFVFDTFLASLMVLETWVMSTVLWLIGVGSRTGYGNASILRILRLLRLTRMARVARLLRAIPELVIMVKGMMVAARSVFFTLFFLLVILYIFGITFVQLTRGTVISGLYFEDVPHAMSTLLLHGCFGEDLPDVAKDVGAEHLGLGVLLMVFVLIASLTIMNMLVGVLVEVVSVVSKVEKERLVVSYVKNQLISLLEKTGVDMDGNGLISREEFELLLMKPEAAQVIQDVGVDVVGLIDFMDFIFGQDMVASEDEDPVELTFAEFMEVILRLRGTNVATVKDIVDLRKFMLERFDGPLQLDQPQPSEDVDHIVKSETQRSTLAGLGLASNPRKKAKTVMAGGARSNRGCGYLGRPMGREVSLGSSPVSIQDVCDADDLSNQNLAEARSPGGSISPTKAKVRWLSDEATLSNGQVVAPKGGVVVSRGLEIPGLSHLLSDDQKDVALSHEEVMQFTPRSRSPASVYVSPVEDGDVEPGGAGAVGASGGGLGDSGDGGTDDPSQEKLPEAPVMRELECQHLHCGDRADGTRPRKGSGRSARSPRSPLRSLASPRNDSGTAVPPWRGVQPRTWPPWGATPHQRVGGLQPRPQLMPPPATAAM